MLPHAKLWDEKEIFPTDVLRKAGELGFGSIYCRCHPIFLRSGVSVLALFHDPIGCIFAGQTTVVRTLAGWALPLFSKRFPQLVRPLQRRQPRPAALRYSIPHCISCFGQLYEHPQHDQLDD